MGSRTRADGRCGHGASPRRGGVGTRVGVTRAVRRSGGQVDVARAHRGDGRTYMPVPYGCRPASPLVETFRKFDRYVSGSISTGEGTVNQKARSVNRTMIDHA